MPQRQGLAVQEKEELLHTPRRVCGLGWWQERAGRVRAHLQEDRGHGWHCTLL